MTATARKPSIRDYDRERMMRMATAMWEGLLLRLKDDAGVVYISSSELLDAMAILGGMTLSSWEGAKVPSQLRQRCEAHAKDLAERTRQAIANPDSRTIFDVVLPDIETEDMH